MQFFSVRRFNYIDIFFCAATLGAIREASYVAAVVCWLVGGAISVAAERRWGR